MGRRLSVGSEVGADRGDRPRPERRQEHERENGDYHNDDRQNCPEPADYGALVTDGAFRDVSVEADATRRTRLE